jgi:hypothetical protein
MDNDEGPVDVPFDFGDPSRLGKLGIDGVGLVKELLADDDARLLAGNAVDGPGMDGKATAEPLFVELDAGVAKPLGGDRGGRVGKLLERPVSGIAILSIAGNEGTVGELLGKAGEAVAAGGIVDVRLDWNGPGVRPPSKSTSRLLAISSNPAGKGVSLPLRAT